METLQTNYQNGKLNERYDILKDGQNNIIKDGKYEKWYKNGNKECEGEYIENIKFGYWKFWYENGEVKEEGEYFNDEKGENWKTYPVSKPEVTEEVKKIDLKPKSTISATSAISTPTISEKQTIENNKKIIKEKEIVPPIPILQKPDPSYIINDIQKRETNIQKPVAAKDNKTIYVVLGGVGFLLIVILLYVFVIKNDSKKELIETKVTSTTQEDTRKRESELKEKEIAENKPELESQKLQQNIPNTNKSKESIENIILNKLNEIIKETNAKNIDIRKFYANEVYYYKGGIMNIDKVMKDKKSFFNKWEKIELSIDNVNISKENEYRYSCLYDKYFLAENHVSQKSYSGKVRSKLIFENNDDNWLITEEKDEKIYYTDKK